MSDFKVLSGALYYHMSLFYLRELLWEQFDALKKLKNITGGKFLQNNSSQDIQVKCCYKSVWKPRSFIYWDMKIFLPFVQTADICLWPSNIEISQVLRNKIRALKVIIKQLPKIRYFSYCTVLLPRKE